MAVAPPGKEAIDDPLGGGGNDAANVRSLLGCIHGASPEGRAPGMPGALPVTDHGLGTSAPVTLPLASSICSDGEPSLATFITMRGWP